MKNETAFRPVGSRDAAGQPPVFALAENDADEALTWTTGNGYGSVVENKDGTASFTGDAELNSDNSHCGPYTRTARPRLRTATLPTSWTL